MAHTEILVVGSDFVAALEAFRSDKFAPDDAGHWDWWVLCQGFLAIADESRLLPAVIDSSGSPPHTAAELAQIESDFEWYALRHQLEYQEDDDEQPVPYRRDLPVRRPGLWDLGPIGALDIDATDALWVAEGRYGFWPPVVILGGTWFELDGPWPWSKPMIDWRAELAIIDPSTPVALFWAHY